MEYRNLGDSGLKISLAGLGCNNFGMRCDADQTRAVVHRALDEGVNFFDSADIYGNRGGSEELLGRALGGRRRDVIVASKFGMPMGDGPYLRGASRRYIVSAVEASLKRLGTDYIDLYQLHQPDPDTPQEETLSALDDLVRGGKVRYLGNSNFSGWQIADAGWISRSRGIARYVSAQNQYSLLDRRIEREVIPACERFGVGMLPYFPLASGFLTGKYRRGSELPEGTRLALMKPMAKQVVTEHNFDILEKLEEFARRREHTIVELAMSWLACQPTVASVIAGATRPEQVTENVKACGWKLLPEELKEVDGITRR
jgi:aryl-alcohol dehydrogenase-like predicted oxidoreductase